MVEENTPVNLKKIYTNLKALTKKWFYTKEENDNLINPLKDYVGINLIPNSRSFTNTDAGTLTGEYYNNYAIRQVDNTSGTGNVDIAYTIPKNTFQPGDKYILNFWAKGGPKVNIYFGGNSGFIKVKTINVSGEKITPNDSNYNYGQVNIDLSSNWRKYSIVWEINPNPASNESINVDKKVQFRTAKTNNNYFCGLSFEKLESSISSSNLSDNDTIIKTSSTSGYIKNDGTIGQNVVETSSTSGYIKNDGSIGQNVVETSSLIWTQLNTNDNRFIAYKNETLKLIWLRIYGDWTFTNEVDGQTYTGFSYPIYPLNSYFAPFSSVDFNFNTNFNFTDTQVNSVYISTDGKIKMDVTNLKASNNVRLSANVFYPYVG